MKRNGNHKRRIRRRVILPVLIIAIAGGLWYLQALLPIMTGYVAKNLASGIFVAGRSQQSLEEKDLHFSILPLTHNNVDYKHHEVISRFLGYQSRAIYIKGYGCILVNGYSPFEIRNRPYQQIAALPLHPDSIPWPLGNRMDTTMPPQINRKKLQQAVQKIMSDTIPFKGTFGLMILYKDQPIAEVYREGFNRHTRFLSWSMAKSFMNTLIGIRVDEGKINIDRPLHLKEWKEGDPRQRINLNNLMQMNSGLQWNESYGSLSDVTIMLHEIGNMGHYAAMKPLKYPPDSVWTYSSGSANLVSLVLRRNFSSDSAYYRFPREKLFNPLGMRSAIFEVDASGTFVGSSYLYATLRDFARYALLYLHNGNWLGKQILPVNWVHYTVSPAKGSGGNYGSFFWLNRGRKNQPSAPEDTYLCEGHDGQYIIIIPSKQLIVVRTGFSKPGDFKTNAMLREILKSLQ